MKKIKVFFGMCKIYINDIKDGCQFGFFKSESYTIKDFLPTSIFKTYNKDTYFWDCIIFKL